MKMNRLLVLGMLLIASPALAVPSTTKFEGSATVVESRIRVTVVETAALVEGRYKVRNDTRTTDKYRVEPLHDEEVAKYQSSSTPASRLSADLALKAGTSANVALSWQIPAEGADTQSLRIDTALVINGRVSFKLVGTQEIQVRLPATAKYIVFASPKPTRVLTQGGRLVAVWEKTAAVPLAISIKWTRLPVNLELSQALSGPGRDGMVTVSTIVTNKGSEAVQGIALRQNFVPAAVDDYEPREQFTTAPHDASDERLLWTAYVKVLRPGESAKFEYRIRFSRTPYHVPGVQAIIKGAIVAVSDALIVKGTVFVPRPPADTYTVIPMGWEFDFTDDDHHIDKHALRNDQFQVDLTAQTASWNTAVTYRDKNGDDDYRWAVAHTLLRIPGGVQIDGDSGWLPKTSSDTSTTSASITRRELIGLEAVTVVLVGWGFDYSSSDHHIKRLGVWLSDVQFDAASGTIRWNANARYADRNGDDNYSWMYRWKVIGIPGGTAQYVTRSGFDARRNATDLGIALMPPSAGSQAVAVLPLGWKFRYRDSDHHINENSVRISNVVANAGAGTISWTGNVGYTDKNFDDGFDWQYDVVVLTLGQGVAGTLGEGPFSDDGGDASHVSTVQLASLFAPVTWTNGVQDGTETGIDCGGDSPVACQSCVLTEIDAGSADDAGLYSLSSTVVSAAAQRALADYADSIGQDPLTYYTGLEQGDRYVTAVAWYVDQNMTWVEDGGDWDGAQSARRTISSSGSRCSMLFCGDCEDHSILRAALLRTLGFAWNCIFSADHHNEDNQGQRLVCPTLSKKEGSGGHTYNVVYFRGKYRLLDYGVMGSYLSFAQCWDQHATDNIWNDHYGELWDARRKSPIGGKPLINYPGNPSCPSVNWNWRTYYSDVCP